MFAHICFDHKKLQCLTVKPFGVVLCCVCDLVIIMFKLLKKEAIDCTILYIYIQVLCVHKHLQTFREKFRLSRAYNSKCVSCVAPTMCASARNMMLRSTDHVCKCKKHDVA